MKEIAISEFEAKCPALLDQVEKTKKPIPVTRRGKIVAERRPPGLEGDFDPALTCRAFKCRPFGAGMC
jgi:hypothetical protein